MIDIAALSYKAYNLAEWARMGKEIWPHLSGRALWQKMLKYYSKGGYDISRSLSNQRRHGRYTPASETERLFNTKVCNLTYRGVDVPYQFTAFIKARYTRQRSPMTMRTPSRKQLTNTRRLVNSLMKHSRKNGIELH
jgi:hypothetical protein